MSASGLDTFDKSYQMATVWMEELSREIGTDHQEAWHVLGDVLRATRDRVPIELAVHLGSQLPMSLRGTYYDGFGSSGPPDRTRTRETFLEMVSSRLSNTRSTDTEAATQPVFRVLSCHVDSGQAAKLMAALPEEVQVLWPGAESTPNRSAQAAQARPGGDLQMPSM